MRDDQSSVNCPAGIEVGETTEGPACRCRITQETITEKENGSTLEFFCHGDYTKCTVWRKEKDAISEDKSRELHREIAKSPVGSADRPA